MSSNKIRKSGYWWKILISQISVSMNSNLFTAVIPKQPDELVPDWSNTSIIHCHLGTNLVARNLNFLHLQTRLLRFFSREMLCISAAYAVMRCPSVCAFVPHVRTFCRNGLTYLRFFHRRVATPFSFFNTKRHGNTPTGTRLMGNLNAVGEAYRSQWTLRRPAAINAIVGAFWS